MKYFRLNQINYYDIQPVIQQKLKKSQCTKTII